MEKTMNQKNKCKEIGVLFLASAILFFMVSCKTIQEPGSVYVPVDYSEETAVDSEIELIQKLPENESVKALWRAELLMQHKADNEKVSAELQACMEKVVALYKKSVEEKKYLDALQYYKSLEACSYAQLSGLEKDGASLETLALEKVPGLSLNANDHTEPAKVSSFIKGTVTVLVDKGIKVEKGMGVADMMLGSGFFISKDGYIVTNHHVITDCVDPKYEGYSRLYIKLAEDPDTRIPAKVIGYDSVLDLALLKAEVTAPYVFTLGSSSGLETGDKVYAIGSPLGLERTLTSGIVSATDRKLFTVGNVFQIDAAVNSGNSGGPLIDEQGRVQAIVFAGVQDYQGLNFAIPIEYLKYELPILYNGGKREHAWLGAYGRTKKQPGSGTKNEGLTIQYVMPGGSASLAGLVAGDVISSINDKPVESLEAFQNYFMTMKTGTIASVTVTNADGVMQKQLVYLDKRPDEPGYEVYKHDVLALSLLPILGMELVPVSTESHRKYSVVSILKGSIADESGFSERDPVDVLEVQFNDKKTAAYIELYTKKRKNGYLDVNMGLTAPLDSPYYF